MPMRLETNNKRHIWTPIGIQVNGLVSKKFQNVVPGMKITKPFISSEFAI